jgi:hypothetical protein
MPETFAGLPPTTRLSGDQQAFLDEARRMVAHLGEPVSEHVRTSARVERFRGSDQLILALTNPVDAITVEASVSDNEIIIDMSQADSWSYHWHFAPTWNDVYGTVPDRSWLSLAVDFVADLLLGEVRVRSTYRGDDLVKIHAEVISAEGEPIASGTAGFPMAAGPKFWRERRHEEATVRLLPSG